MKKVQINIDIEQYQTLEELNQEDRDLIINAKNTCKNAYAPYSHFKVGVALLLENGVVINGTNQENSAYPSGMCAERVALFYANSQYPDVPVKALALSAFYEEKFTDTITAPCGACRQVIIETEYRFKKPIKLLLFSSSKILILNKASDLMPLSFSGDNLFK
jgi:cytidine deaminase